MRDGAFIRGRRRFLVAPVLLLLTFGFGAGSASAATERLDPVSESRRALVFALDGVATDSVRDAYAEIRTRGRTTRERVGAERVHDAASRRIKVRKPRPSAAGTLVLTTTDGSSTSSGGDTGGDSTAPGGDEPAPPPAPAPAACNPAGLVNLTLSGCSELLADPGTSADPNPTWGSTDCASASRHRRVDGGGDTHSTAAGAAQSDGSYRELTVLDGDDFWGERCELGRNNHKDGPTAVYREGDHAITFASFRLPATYPLEDSRWQVVMQMKQTQPSANGGGTPVISLEAKAGRWRLLQSTSNGPSGDTRELWTAPAARGVWTRFAFDVNYSQDPSRGSIQVSADLDGDGDASDSAERSPAIGTYTLKRETEGGSSTDGVAPGESIPSHLRAGIYHHPDIPCPPPTGCAVEIDNVQILDAG